MLDNSVLSIMSTYIEEFLNQDISSKKFVNAVFANRDKDFKMQAEQIFDKLEKIRNLDLNNDQKSEKIEKISEKLYILLSK